MAPAEAEAQCAELCKGGKVSREGAAALGDLELVAACALRMGMRCRRSHKAVVSLAGGELLRDAEM